MRMDVVEGSTVQFEAGPFLDSAGAVLNLTSWTVKLHTRKPDGTTEQYDGIGTDAGMMLATPAAGELTPTGTWEARLEGISGGTRRYGDLIVFRVVPIAGFAP